MSAPIPFERQIRRWHRVEHCLRINKRRLLARRFLLTLGAGLFAAYAGINTLAVDGSRYGVSDCYACDGSERSWLREFQREGVFGSAYVAVAKASQDPTRWALDERTYRRLFGEPPRAD